MLVEGTSVGFPAHFPDVSFNMASGKPIVLNEYLYVARRYLYVARRSRGREATIKLSICSKFKYHAYLEYLYVAT